MPVQAATFEDADSETFEEKPTRVTVERQFDAKRINAILNDPYVRPWVADMSEGVIDMSAAVANPENVLLVGEYGCNFFFKVMPGIFEVHTACLTEGRGAWALGMVRASAMWMFTRSDAFEIITRVPRGHFGAKWLSRAAGMKYEFTREDCCKFLGRDRPVDIYSFRIQDWIGGAQGLEEIGHVFHERLHSEAKRLGITTPAHENDAQHNHYLGACVEMVRHGQTVKAVCWYNRWAFVSRHAQIKLVSLDPPTVQFDIGLLRLNPDGEFEVLPC